MVPKRVMSVPGADLQPHVFTFLGIGGHRQQRLVLCDGHEVTRTVVYCDLGTLFQRAWTFNRHKAPGSFIQAFQGIAIAGSASLAVVAPGIAEALIATAAGLIAAIPASIFYNDFAARIDEIRAAIDLFREEFSEDLVRMGTGGQN